MDAQQKREEFLNELTILLKKYNCSIALEDFGRAYSSNEKIVIDFEYDQELGIIEQLLIGSYLDGN